MRLPLVEVTSINMGIQRMVAGRSPVQHYEKPSAMKKNMFALFAVIVMTCGAGLQNGAGKMQTIVNLCTCVCLCKFVGLAQFVF